MAAKRSKRKPPLRVERPEEALQKAQRAALKRALRTQREINALTKRLERDVLRADQALIDLAGFLAERVGLDLVKPDGAPAGLSQS